MGVVPDIRADAEHYDFARVVLRYGGHDEATDEDGDGGECGRESHVGGLNSSDGKK